jgi:ribose transport system permease protein
MSTAPTSPSPIDYQSADPEGRSLVPAGVARALGSIIGPLIGLIVVLAIFGAWRPTKFLTVGNFTNVLTNNYHFLVAAVGMTFVIVTAGIDLSVGSTMALACVCCAMTIQGVAFPQYSAGTIIVSGSAVGLIVGIGLAGVLLRGGRHPARALGWGAAVGGGAGLVIALLMVLVGGHASSPMPAVVGAGVGIAVGALVGVLNGGLITSLGLPPFIVTLATLEAIRGLVLYISGGTPVSPDYTWAPRAKDAMDSLRLLHFGSFLGFPPNVWIGLAVVLVGAPLLHLTVLGRYAYAIGSNERTARLCGVNVERYTTICYVISGATAGLAGVMMAAKFKGGQPAEFTGAELTVIAAVVIGGTSLFGGEGTIVGTLLGILMLGLLYSGCVIADISSFVQRIFIGGTIVLAVALDRFRHLRG